jgi:glutamine synthetase
LCESYVWVDKDFSALKPANTNFRHYAKQILDAVVEHKPWFGIEQEYSLLEYQNKFAIKPLGWPSSGYPGA